MFFKYNSEKTPKNFNTFSILRRNRSFNRSETGEKKSRNGERGANQIIFHHDNFLPHCQSIFSPPESIMTLVLFIVESK